MWRNLWTILLFAFDAAVMAFLVLAVLFFLRQDWLPAALTTLGSIGTTYSVSDKLLFRENIASAYRILNVAELTQNGLHGVYYEQGDPDLRYQRTFTDLLQSFVF